ncbi:MAG: alkylphosphonate utilization protein [Rhodobacterales bacterium]
MPCVLCGAADTTFYTVLPMEAEVPLCGICLSGVTGAVDDAPHWRCLTDAVWSGDHGTQVVAWRVLHRIDAAWARDLLDIVYLEPEVQAWAAAGLALGEQPAAIIHRDSNGTVLEQGDNVHLIKDLPVKGAGFTAKRGTVVRGISLVADNAQQIEGRVEGQRIVILTAFVKKS